MYYVERTVQNYLCMPGTISCIQFSLICLLQRMRSVASHSNRHHTMPTQSQSRTLATSPQSHTAHHPYPNPRPRIHALHPPPLPPRQHMINIQPMPPQPQTDIQSVVQPSLQHQVMAAAAGSSPAILPNLLSWQMSQSFNTYPWRMQANGVPFFTFPSTPPSFIPANSYPYTFAPLPAAPFSISPMQPVPSTVPMPSYNGLSVMVPQVTTVDTGAVPLNGNQGNVVTQGYAVAAPTAAVPAQPDQELQAVAVHVLQPRTTTLPDHQLHQYQNMTQASLGVTPAAPPALIPTEQPMPPRPLQRPTQPQASNNSTPFVYEVITSEHLSTVNPHVQQSQHLQSSNSTLQSSLDSDIPHDDGYSQLPVVSLDDSEVIWGEVPGPSGLNQAPSPHPDSQSSRDSTPEMSSFPSFSADNESDDTSDVPPTPNLSASPAVVFDESTSFLSSDQEDSSLEMTPRDTSTDSSTASALHTLANAAAILADSPSQAGSSSVPSQPSTGQPVRMPVLINISDSESDSHLSPSSIIDLTHSPATTSSHRSPLAHTNAYNYNIASAPDSTTRNGPLAQRTSTSITHYQEPPAPMPHHQEPPAPTMHSDSHISAVLVPVIHQWNGGTAEHQGLQQIPRYVGGDQISVVQATPSSIDEVSAHMAHPSASLNSDTPVVAPVQLQQSYPMQQYSGGTRAAIARWPTEISAARHAVLYPPHQSGTNTPQGNFWDTVIVRIV